MAVVTMKSLLESGVHFGHRTHRWHPSMKPYIFTERNGIHIINLQLTLKALEGAYTLIQDTVAEGGTILFVGTKRQAQETIEAEATRCGMPYVTVRWLGGMLTNYRTIRERINELERLERMRDGGEFDHLTKKEALMLGRKIEKLQMRFNGTRNMVGLPDMLFVVDVRREETAIHEANLLEIPVIAMVDTNCDPRTVDFVIPSNDDAIRAIKLLVGKVADAVLDGKAMRKEEEIEEFEPGALVVDEPELTDEELLGEATLAKLREVEAEGEAVATEELAEAEGDSEGEVVGVEQPAEAEGDEQIKDEPAEASEMVAEGAAAEGESVAESVSEAETEEVIQGPESVGSSDEPVDEAEEAAGEGSPEQEVEELEPEQEEEGEG